MTPHQLTIPVEENIKERKLWDKKRESIYESNLQLIEKWRSMPDKPWWKFWGKSNKPSFEEQRSIILSNWGQLDQ